MVVFLRRYTKISPPIRRASPATPPTVPPTMAPVDDEEDFFESVGVVVADDEVDDPGFCGVEVVGLMLKI